MTSTFVVVTCCFCVFAALGKDIPSITAFAESGIDEGDSKEQKDGSPPVVAPPFHSDESNSIHDQNSLAEALRVLHRRKREISRAHRPYSAYSPLGTHRYRYPLYRKRAAYLPHYYGGDESYDSTDYESNYDAYIEEQEKPSLFRERERGPRQKLISNAHFSSKKPLYRKRTVPRIPTSMYGQMKQSSIYNLDNSPYNWSVMGKLYERGKRTWGDSPGRAGQLDLYDDELFLPSVRDGLGMDGKRRLSEEERDAVYANLLKSVINEYKTTDASSLNGLIRKKRSINIQKSPLAVQTSGESKNETLDNSGKKRGVKLETAKISSTQMDRRKRAYETFENPGEDESDFLAREYFKTIARSVGNQKKRMAFAKFEAQKRSNDIGAFLENPRMLHFVQEQIRGAEEEVAKDAEEEIEKDSSSVGGTREDIAAKVLLGSSIARLDALERMREALYQLERLQEQEVMLKRAQKLVNGLSEEASLQEREKEKRRKALKGRAMRERQMEDQREEEDQQRKRKVEEKQENLAKGSKRDECPVLERIVINCIAVTKMVVDDAMVFLEPCLRHEVCYMCGSGLEVSRHECDALLSSALESSCNEAYAIPGPSNGSLDCLSAAGDTYNILSDDSRYDDKGTCTFDPCVRQLIDSR